MTYGFVTFDTLIDIRQFLKYCKCSQRILTTKNITEIDNNFSNLIHIKPTGMHKVQIIDVPYISIYIYTCIHVTILYMNIFRCPWSCIFYNRGIDQDLVMCQTISLDK